jgi:hypothetical protein
MKGANEENESRVRRQQIDLEHAQREYQRAKEECRYGTRRIVAAAREEIAKLRFQRDETLLRIRREQNELNYCRGLRDRGFD